MFCSNCGHEVVANAQFCPECGSRIGNEITKAKPANHSRFMSKAEEDNQYLIQAMKSLLPPLEKIGKTIDTLDSNKNTITKAKKELKGHKSIWVPPIIITLFIFKAFPFLSIFVSNGKMLMILWIVAIVISIVLGISKDKNNKKAVKELVPMQETLIQQLNDICKTINPEYMHLIPKDYRNFQACKFFHTAFLNGRAGDMQQVVNLYEEEMHRNRMENLQTQQVAQLKKMQSTLSGIRASSAISAATSSANLFVNLFG